MNISQLFGYRTIMTMIVVVCAVALVGTYILVNYPILPTKPCIESINPGHMFMICY